MHGVTMKFYVTLCCQLSDNTIIRQYRCLNSLTSQTLSIIFIKIYNTQHFGDSISTPSSDLIFQKQMPLHMHVLYASA